MKLNLTWVIFSANLSLVYPLHYFIILIEWWYGTSVSFNPWIIKTGHFIVCAICELSNVYFKKVAATFPYKS